jgi:hypothetical protein
MSRDEFGELDREPDKHIREKGTAEEKRMARLKRYATAPLRPGASVAQRLAHLLFDWDPVTQSIDHDQEEDQAPGSGKFA